MSRSWIERYARAGLAERVGMLGGGAVRLLATAIERGLDRTATTVVEARDAFARELDPNTSDARIVDESDEPFEPTGP